jgi:hypothetical protein
MTERINRMKLAAWIFYGACLGLIAGYYVVLLLCFVFLPRLGNLVGLPAAFVGAPLGMLIGAIAGGRLCARLGGRNGEKSPARKVIGAVVGSLVGGLIANVAVAGVLCLYGILGWSFLLDKSFHGVRNVYEFCARAAVVGARIAGGIYGATSDKKKVVSGCLGAFVGCVAGALLGGAAGLLSVPAGGIFAIAFYGGALSGIIVGLVCGLRRPDGKQIASNAPAKRTA